MQVSESQKQQIRTLLIEGKKFEAVKYLRDNFNLSLKDANRMADLIDEDIGEDEYTYDRKSTQAAVKKVGCAIGSIFTAIGAPLLILALYYYTDNQLLVNSGELVTGKVISTPEQPVFEYEFNGNTYDYQSSVSSSPPSYELGEEVMIYVNTEDPHDILINTFSDRWFGITLFGIMGSIFFLIGVAVLRRFRKKKV